jgi:hypothetical protein
VAQITLAFCHIHVHSRDLSLTQATRAAGQTTPLPANDDAHCKFCAAIHVASTLIPAACPDLILPNTTYSVAPPVCFVQPRAAARASPFRSRAPPQAMNV